MSQAREQLNSSNLEFKRGVRKPSVRPEDSQSLAVPEIVTDEAQFRGRWLTNSVMCGPAALVRAEHGGDGWPTVRPLRESFEEHPLEGITPELRNPRNQVRVPHIGGVRAKSTND